jgi:hypothetical protein
MSMNVIGKRRSYRNLYERFWQKLNWQLPDSILSSIWKMDRGNLHAWRIRLRQLPPRWRVRGHENHPVFRAAVQLEKLKAKNFTGPRPAKPFTTSKGNVMPIPTEIRLELLSYNDEGEPSFRLGVELVESGRQRLTATIEPHQNMPHPQISCVADEIGLQDQDCQALLLVAYEKMKRYHGTGPTGGTIQLSRWVTPDISSWVRRATYQPISSRILRVMRGLQPAGVPSSPIKEFTESLEA